MPTAYYHKPTAYLNQSYHNLYIKPENVIISRLKALKAKIIKVSPTAIRDNKWSDLHLAVGSQEIKLVKALCNEKNINIPDAKCRTALELAILGGNLEMVEFLVEKGGEIAPNMYGWSAIHLAIKIGNLEIVKYLYENTEFQKCDKYGYTLQYWAAASGNEQIIQFFLNKDNINKTPLELAVEAKDISSIKMLINKGVKFDIKSELGYKIFNLAINAGDLKLIEHLTDRTLSDKFNPSALKQQTLLDKLLQIHDKNINVAKAAKLLIDEQPIDNKLGQKLLNFAAGADDLELVKALHEKGIRLDSKDLLGRTSLHFAIKAGAGEELMQFLINNIDCNARDKSGSTLLHWAANNHNTLAAKLLLANGAYSFIPDYLNQTPLKLAEYYGDNEMIEILTLGDHSEFVS